MFRRTGTSLLALAAVATGCGGAGSELQKAFPDASDDDAALLKRSAQRFDRVFSDDVAAVAAIHRGDVGGLGRAAARLAGDGRALVGVGTGVDSGELADVLTRYGRGVARLGADYGHLAGAATAHEAYRVRRVVRDVVTDKRAVQRQDHRLLTAVRPALSAAQQRVLDEQIRVRNRRYHRAASGP